MTELENCKCVYEKYLTERDLIVHPYIVLCGKSYDINEAFLIVNSKNYPFSNAVKAFDACFKVSSALHTWSTVTDHLWLLIQQVVFKINPNISPAFLTKEYASVRLFIEKLYALEKRASIS